MTESSNTTVIAVIGPDDAGNETLISPQALAAAERVGNLIGERGGIVLTNGMGGIMEAASRGGALAGALVVGLMPGEDRREANPYVTVPLATGLGYFQNSLLVRAADAVIMIGGLDETLHEAIVAYGRKPLIAVTGTGGWSDRLERVLYNGHSFDERESGEILFVTTPEEAVEEAFQLVQSFKPKEGITLSFQPDPRNLPDPS